jgi:hypothetical protein
MSHVLRESARQVFLNVGENVLVTGILSMAYLTFLLLRVPLEQWVDQALLGV